MWIAKESFSEIDIHNSDEKYEYVDQIWRLKPRLRVVYEMTNALDSASHWKRKYN